MPVTDDCAVVIGRAVTWRVGNGNEFDMRRMLIDDRLSRSQQVRFGITLVESKNYVDISKSADSLERNVARTTGADSDDVYIDISAVYRALGLSAGGVVSTSDWSDLPRNRTVQPSHLETGQPSNPEG